MVKNLKHVQEQLNDLNKRVCILSETMHAESGQRIDETEDALCETSADFDQRIADIEDALCELTEEE